MLVNMVYGFPCSWKLGVRTWSLKRLWLNRNKITPEGLLGYIPHLLHRWTILGIKHLNPKVVVAKACRNILGQVKICGSPAKLYLRAPSVALFGSLMTNVQPEVSLNCPPNPKARERIHSLFAVMNLRCIGVNTKAGYPPRDLLKQQKFIFFLMTLEALSPRSRAGRAGVLGKFLVAVVAGVSQCPYMAFLHDHTHDNCFFLLWEVLTTCVALQPHPCDLIPPSLSLPRPSLLSQIEANAPTCEFYWDTINSTAQMKEFVCTFL